jgi:hypothetical protein
VLVAQARARHASLCPHCYALVPLPQSEAPLALYFGVAGLSAGGYRVQVKDSGLAPRLEVRTPAGLVYRGREPGSRRTRLGALVVFAGPLLLAAGGLAFLPALGGLPQWLPAAVAGGLGLLAALGVLLFWPSARTPHARTLQHAWRVLVPRLLRDRLPAEELPLLAGLAEVSAGRGETDDLKTRAGPVSGARRAAEEAVRDRPALGFCAGVVARLDIEDAARLGEDPVPALTAELTRCLQGELPLSLAVGLLRDRETECWSPEERESLRAELCRRAFDAGLGTQDLLDAGRACEALGALLGIARDTTLTQFEEALPPGLEGPHPQSAEATRRLVERNGVPCPGCRLLVLPCVGEVGVAADQGAGQAPAVQKV